MRRLIFILMIVLLPLRGWMGEAMATEMSAMDIIASQAINTPATDDIHSKMSKSDCEMHSTNATNHAEISDNGDQDATTPTCELCQACHAAGIVTTVKIDSIAAVNFAQPLAYNSQFASAHIAFGQKPPII